MKRLFIPLGKIQIYDEFHRLQPDGNFEVDFKKDGKSTEEHRQGIEYIKSVLKKGKKIRPILVVDNEDGTFFLLDGFKRSIAYKELNYKNVEAFVCDRLEYFIRRDNPEETIPYDVGKMWAGKGGQPKEVYSLFEGKQTEGEFKYDDLIFLYKSENPAGLRIEIDENIHIHWGEFGKNRLALGRKDFIQLAEAISKI
jgi:hypothetical protein